MAKVTSKSWSIWIFASLFYLYEMILRVSPSVMTNDLMNAYNISSTMLGVIISFYYYAYTILQLPCGLILDKLGPRNLLAASALLCSVGSYMFAGSTEIYVAQFGRFLIGAGSACAFISCLHIASSLFPVKYFPVLAGATNMMGTLGSLFGGYPVAMAVNSVGWESTVYFLAFIGLVITVLMFVFVPKRLNSKEQMQSVPIFKSIKTIIVNKQIILAGCIAGFMYLPISAFSELWAVPFFMSKYSINNEFAAVASSVLFTGVSIGSVVMAIFARTIRSYVKTIKISTLLTAFLFVPLIYLQMNIWLAFAIVFFIGLSTGAQVINFTCAKNNSKKELSGTTLALTNAIVMLIGSVFQPALGLLLDVFWGGQFMPNGLRFYDITAYQKSMLVIPICLIVSYAMAMKVKETINTEQS